ncbi:MAG: type II toxin-antitoxin system VapC family toxin [Candidatus Sulfotelmatobacter sp.]|jgi:predicted nucleic acid-binding protein
MIVLDTNVFSALMQVAPEPKVIAWLDRQSRTSIWTTSVTVFEIRFGLQIMSNGKRRTALLQKFESLLGRLEHRVASFDDAAASQAADLMALRQSKGRPIDLRDTMIAGIVLARQAAIATRNVAHFNDIAATVLNPWDA